MCSYAETHCIHIQHELNITGSPSFLYIIRGSHHSGYTDRLMEMTFGRCIRTFQGNCYCHLQNRNYPHGRGSMFLQNMVPIYQTTWCPIPEDCTLYFSIYNANTAKLFWRKEMHRCQLQGKVDTHDIIKGCHQYGDYRLCCPFLSANSKAPCFNADFSTIIVILAFGNCNIPLIAMSNILGFLTTLFTFLIPA